MRVYTTVDILQKAITESHPFRDFMSSAPLIQPHPTRRNAWILQGTVRTKTTRKHLRRQLDAYASTVEVLPRTDEVYPCSLVLHASNLAIIERVVYLRGIGLRQREYNRRITECREANQLPPDFPFCPPDRMFENSTIRKIHRNGGTFYHDGAQGTMVITVPDETEKLAPKPAPIHKDNVTTFIPRPKNEKPGT